VSNINIAVKVITLKLLLSRAYLVEIDSKTILVDAGIPGEEKRILRGLKSAGFGKVDLIYITHAHIDHCGSAAAIREITGAPIAVHEADSDALAVGESRLGTGRGFGKLVKRIFPLIQRVYPSPPAPPDIILHDEQELSDLGFEASVLHTPGHTYGSSCLLVGDVAFVGDLLTSTGGVPHLQRYFAESWSSLEPSLEKLVAAAPKIAYPGHGAMPIIFDELKRLLNQ
jgi:hydroxyacylglutathione hydrolase